MEVANNNNAINIFFMLKIWTYRVNDQNKNKFYRPL
jgi:hypothetical protein